VEVEVVTALRRIEAARAREAVGMASVEQARESQRIIRDRFDAGIAGTDEVLRASTALLDAEARRTAARVDRLVSQAMLDRAVGRRR
jgi:outer membrane protein TolC